MVYEITPDQVQDTIKAHSLCMVNFGAEWCIDCRRAAPFYKKFSEEFTDVYFTHVNVGDRDGELREELRGLYNIGHIPTMIFYKDGKEIDRIVEVQTPVELKKFIERCKA